VGETATQGTGLPLIVTHAFLSNAGRQQVVWDELVSSIRQNAGLLMFTGLALSLKPEKQLQNVSDLCVSVLPNVPGMGPQRSQQGHNFHFRPDRKD